MIKAKLTGMLLSRIDHDGRLACRPMAATVKNSGVPAMPSRSRTVQAKSTATPPHSREQARRAPRRAGGGTDRVPGAIPGRDSRSARDALGGWSGCAWRGLASTERASGLISQRDGDQPCLQRGLGAWLGLEHEPAVVPAVAEGAQLDLLRGQA